MVSSFFVLSLHIFESDAISELFYSFWKIIFCLFSTGAVNFCLGYACTGTITSEAAAFYYFEFLRFSSLF